MIIHSPIISGSLTFADGSTLSLPAGSVYSGSFSGSAQFSEVSSHIIPDTANTYDLGSATNFFRDLYISTGSLKGMGSGGNVVFKFAGKEGGGLKVTDDSDNEVEIQAKEITLKDTSGNGNNIKLKVENGALKSKKVNNSDVEQSEEPQTANSDISGSLVVSGSSTLSNTTIGGTLDTTGLASLDGGINVADNLTVDASGNTVVGGTLDSTGLASLDGGIDVDGVFTVADGTGDVSTTGTLAAGNTTITGTVDASGLSSLDGGIDVDGVFTVADGTGNVSTTGTLAAGNTTITGTVDASGLASLDGGIDVDGAFTVADTTGNVSTTGTLAAGNTTITGTVDASGLISADGGLDVDGAFTVADTSGNVSTSGTLNVTGLTTVGVISGSAGDFTGNLSVGGNIVVGGSLTSEGHLLPAAHNTYDLGSTSLYWRDLYLSSGSLYINGIQVLSTSGTDFLVQTDAGENFKIQETGADTITLETANGDITLTATGTGNIELDAPIQIAAGNNILSSDGNAITFANDVDLGSNNIYAANLSGIISSSAITYDGNNIDVAGNTTIQGNLTVQGTQTQLNTTTLNIEDKNLLLASGAADSAAANGASLTVDGSDATLLYTSANDAWEVNKAFRVPSHEITANGLTLSGNLSVGQDQIRINGTLVTTTATELNQLDGNTVGGTTAGDIADIDSTQTFTNKTWNGVAIAHDYIGLDAIDGTNISDDSIDSEHIADGAIDNAHLAADSVNGAKIADDSIDSEHIVDGAIDNAHLAADSVDGSKIADDSINSEHYVDGSIDNAHLAADSVNGAKIADDSIDSEHIVDGSIDNVHLAGSIAASKITEISNLTADEGAQLENINSVTISNTQWGYLGAMNQGVTTSSNVTFGNVNGATGTFTGDVIAYSSSDIRLKDNIEVISNPIEKVQQLKGVTWDWNDNADELQKSLPNVGVIAQDVEKVLPQLVKDRDNGFKGVDYDKIVGLLIEAIKDQQTQIDELKSKLS